MTSAGASNDTAGGGDSSVEYFLLEPPAAAATAAGGSRHSSSRRGRTASEEVEILSPISHHRDDSSSAGILLRNNSNNIRNSNKKNLVFFEDDNEDDEEEALTLPSAQPHDSLVLTNPARRRRHLRPRLRSSFSERAVRTTSELSGLNYLNLTAYGAHVFVWYGVAVAGLLGAATTRWSRTEYYQTLVTPTNWAANYLWIPILLTQGAFAAAQLLPPYRTRPVVTSGIGYYFFYVVLLQIAYTFLYSFGLFYFSFAAVVATAVALLSLLVSQHHQHHHHGNSSAAAADGGTGGAIAEYVLFRLPFFLHAGWVVLQTADHFALLFRRYCPENAALQLAVDVVALAVLLPVAVTALAQAHDFVIPTVILWSYVSIVPATVQYCCIVKQRRHWAHCRCRFSHITISVLCVSFFTPRLALPSG